MSIGIFSINKKNEIISLNKSAVKYARNDCKDVRWFPDGSLQLNDLVVQIQKNSESSYMEILIGLWDNKDVIPLTKRIQLESFSEFCTVFAENKISIIKDDDQLNVVINNQQHNFNLENDSITLAGRLGRIIYFSNCSKTNMETLKGNSFSGYYDTDVLIKLDDFFDEEVVNVISNLSYEKEKEYVRVGNRKVCIRLLPLTDDEKGEMTFSIGDVDEYYELMKEYSQTYNKLYYENELKLSENQLDNVARLKGFGQNILEINNKFEKVCRKNVTIVLTGESGTGKTYFAKQIHNNSKRRGKPFVSVNCAAIAPNLIESELFGYEDGAFTGARKGGKQGYFEMANGGTLFLDEISELPVLLQGKLLEVLQENTFYRVGGSKKISVDVRLIVATNRNLEKMVQDGLFREDLYYRINVFPIHLPPLRERTRDMYSIIEDTLPNICKRLDMDVPIINQEAMVEIQNYNWPGNIRELENVLEKAAVMSEDNVIKKEDIVINNSVNGQKIAKTLKEKMNEYEKIVIKEAYERFEGNRKLMEEYLGVSKTNLFEKIHKYGLEKEGDN